MKRFKKTFNTISKLALALVLLLGLSFSLEGCGETKKENYTSLSQLEDKKIGVLTGSSAESLVLDYFPNATKVYYQTQADMCLGLIQNKIDAFIEADAVYEDIKTKQGGFACFENPISAVQQGAIFAKDNPLGQEYNSFIVNLYETGELEKIHDDWFYNGYCYVDKNIEDTSNGTLKVATYDAGFPFSYYLNGEIVGYEIDLLYRFAKEHHYGINTESPTIAAIIAGISTNKYDIALGDIDITEERKQNFYFAYPTSTTDFLIVIKDYTKENDKTFFDTAIESFKRTLIEEDRYKLILKGTLNTAIISVCSIVFGLIIGFLLYLVTRNNNKIITILAKIYNWIIIGLPSLVLLMIFYYVIFANSSISNIAVSVIAFSFTFGMASYSCIKTSIDTIDRVQVESALSLGYTESQAFTRVVVPQALRVFVPIFKNEIVNLIKATAIVGYISTEDLTKMSDIIRSRTFEAFFPLIIVAIIYFVIIFLIIFAINKIHVASDPRLRSKEKILKGVNLHD